MTVRRKGYLSSGDRTTRWPHALSIRGTLDQGDTTDGCGGPVWTRLRLRGLLADPGPDRTGVTVSLRYVVPGRWALGHNKQAPLHRNSWRTAPHSPSLTNQPATNPAWLALGQWWPEACSGYRPPSMEGHCVRRSARRKKGAWLLWLMTTTPEVRPEWLLVVAHNTATEPMEECTILRPTAASPPPAPCAGGLPWWMSGLPP